MLKARVRIEYKRRKWKVFVEVSFEFLWLQTSQKSIQESLFLRLSWVSLKVVRSILGKSFRAAFSSYGSRMNKKNTYCFRQRKNKGDHRTGKCSSALDTTGSNVSCNDMKFKDKLYRGHLPLSIFTSSSSWLSRCEKSLRRSALEWWDYLWNHHAW